MKPEKILDNLNSLEKNAFLKIIDGIMSPKFRNAEIRACEYCTFQKSTRISL